MRIPSSVFAVGRYALALVSDHGFGGADERAKKDCIHGARQGLLRRSEATVNFVRPGLTMTIVSANIAKTARSVSIISSPIRKDLPLDPDGHHTPGAVSVSFLCAYIPKGQTQFYLLRHARADQPDHQGDGHSGGRGFRRHHQDRSPIGEYLYTFKTKAVGQDGGLRSRPPPTASASTASRNLTEFDLGTNYDADDDLDFLPGGGKADQHPRRDPHGDLQQVPRPARVPRRLARRAWNSASCATRRRPSIPTPGTRWT